MHSNFKSHLCVQQNIMNHLPLPPNQSNASPSYEEVKEVKKRMDKMYKRGCDDQTIQQLRWNNERWYSYYMDEEKA